MMNKITRYLKKIDGDIKPAPKVDNRCLVCLESIDEWSRCTLNDCGHDQFCYTCISRWSEITNKCPLCNKRFYYYSSVGSSELAYIGQDRDQPNTLDEEIYRDIICQVCRLSTGEETMLLCDACDNGYHTDCINLKHIPILEEWFCEKCIKKKSKAKQKKQHEEMQKAAKDGIKFEDYSTCKKRKARKKKAGKKKVKKAEVVKNDDLLSEVACSIIKIAQKKEIKVDDAEKDGDLLKEAIRSKKKVAQKKETKADAEEKDSELLKEAICSKKKVAKKKEVKTEDTEKNDDLLKDAICKKRKIGKRKEIKIEVMVEKFKRSARAKNNESAQAAWNEQYVFY
ncbi:unnamed protein product [Blepharisma stoltei]|uniref:PHD and RING finger domain-containing protein 1 n=1 Tax=Blepharisma stoltei TaxID=1481888 RepID=A0AAU9J1F4_9CILI|nr:unnamed protein product [Blepharisma stoltei]